MEKTNRPGRPTLDADRQPSTQVGVRMPPQHFDKLYKRAERDGVSIAEVIRQQLRPLTEGE